MAVSEISDVFVSYRRKNVEFTQKLVKSLQDAGKEVWIDWEDIPPGSVGFTDDIARGIEGADAFIAVLSPDYLQSDYCIMELEYALQLNKKMIPIVYEKFDDYDIPGGIGHINWIYFVPHAGQSNVFEESYPKIIDAMDTDHEHQRTSKRFLLRALDWETHDRRNGFLLTGDEIAQAEAWLANSAGKDPLPSDLQKDYISLSRKIATQRQRQLLTGVSVALVLTIFLAIFSGLQWNSARLAKEDAEQQRDLAERERDVASSIALLSGAQERTSSDRIESVALSLEAISLDNPPNLVERQFSEIGYQPGATRGFFGIEETVRVVAVHPDGTYLATGTEAASQETDIPDIGYIYITDLETGDILTILEGHEGDIDSLAFSPDGQYLASGDADNIANIWLVEDWSRLHQLEGHSRDVNALAFSPDSTELATGSADETVIIWDVETGEQVTLIDMQERIFALAYHPDGNRLAISTRDDVTYLWDLAENVELDVFADHADSVNAVSFSPDGSLLVSASSDRTVVIRNINTGTIKRLLQHSRLVRTAEISPDGQFLVTASDDRSLILWNLPQETVIFQASGLERVLDVAFLPDSGSFIIADNSTIPTEWTTQISGAQLDFYEFSTYDINAVDISPDGNFIAEATASNLVNLYNRSNGSVFVFREHRQSVNAVAFSEDGTRIASGDGVGIIHIWDANSGEILQTFDQEGLAVNDLAFSSDEAGFLVSGGGLLTAPVLIMWDTETGATIREFEAHDGVINGIAISPDDSMIASGEIGDRAIIWDAQTGDILHNLTEHTNEVRSVAFSPDSSQLITASFDQTMILWDVATGDAIRQYVGHSDVIRDVTFSPDGSIIMSGGSDDVVLLWDIADATGPIRTYEGHLDNILSVVFSDDGTFFASSGVDNKTIIWRYDTLEELEAWVRANRYTPELSCNTQRQFSLELSPSCTG